MIVTQDENIQSAETKEESVNGGELKTSVPELKKPSQATPGNFREASYFVLFIAAVFVINAMETGSYRTPWPVALVTALIGIGMFGYSLYLQNRLKA